MRTRSIVCGVDFSNSSARALRHAAALARRGGACLLVLFVEDPLLAAAGRGSGRARDARTRQNGAAVAWIDNGRRPPPRTGAGTGGAVIKMDDQQQLITALRLPHVDTHISCVLFDHGVAYKIKKAVRFPFLDFSTLAKREFYCREELRLNGRLAPSIYLDVVPITGSVGAPVIGGSGPAIEYAVKMREFDQDGLLSRAIERDELTTERVDELAGVVAEFHTQTAVAAGGTPYGEPAVILKDARDNFAALGGVDALRDWTEREAKRCARVFEARKRDGFIRECHGDLHLGNIALVDNRVTLFDCIEFNPAMRWIDVMSDVAFVVMDLRDRRRGDLAARFLNTYLERTGDYAGLEVLRFYVVYRAMVRAKVAALAGQSAGVDSYVGLATRETAPAQPSIVITHGVAGSGKSTRARALVDAGAVAIRSDVERHRLFGAGVYTAASTAATYRRLADLAKTIVLAGYTVVVDATFLKRAQRDLLHAVATDLRVPFVIADCTAPVAVLRDRIARRLERGTDASEATADVLMQQLSTEEPLAMDELSSRLP